MNSAIQITKTTGNHTEDEEQKGDDVIQVPEELFECLKELVVRVCNLVRYYDIMLPFDYRAAFDFYFADDLYIRGALGLEYEPDLLSKSKNNAHPLVVEGIDAIGLTNYMSKRREEVSGGQASENIYNFLHHRDDWLKIAIDAAIAAKLISTIENFDRAWKYVNMGTYYISRAEIICSLEVRISTALKQKKSKSKSDSSQKTINEKKIWIDLFFHNAPASGWENLKVALYAIEPHLIEELKRRKPEETEINIKKESKDLREKLLKWMRTDLNLKYKIYRHLHNKIVPELTELV